MMRLDKFLAHAGFGTRKEVKLLLKAKRVSVNDCYDVKDQTKINSSKDIVKVDEEIVKWNLFQYIMLHKPAGVVSAKKDLHDATVMDCIDTFLAHDVAPIGRLDKDTEGLLLLSNDGQLAHQLLSFKYHVDKVYEVHLAKEITENNLIELKKGIVLHDFVCQPAKVDVMDSKTILLTIQEGKFHQVKKMMRAIDNEVIYLKRVGFGPLLLDDSLKKGEWRFLSQEEIDLLYQEVRKE